MEDKFKLSADFSFLCSADKVCIKSWKVLLGRRSASWRDKVGSDTFYGHKGTGQQKLMSHNLYLYKHCNVGWEMIKVLMLKTLL